MLSLIPTGTPASGRLSPAASRRSTSRASDAILSASLDRKAETLGSSLSMRAVVAQRRRGRDGRFGEIGLGDLGDLLDVAEDVPKLRSERREFSGIEPQAGEARDPLDPGRGKEGRFRIGRHSK